jgi:hypothetical protein
MPPTVMPPPAVTLRALYVMFAASMFGMTRRFASSVSSDSGNSWSRRFFDSAESARISPSTARPGARSLIISSASRILTADGASELPKLECDSSAMLGFTPKRWTSSAASSVISAISSADGSRLMCVSQMKSWRPGRMIICITAMVLAPSRSPMTCRI